MNIFDPSNFEEILSGPKVLIRCFSKKSTNPFTKFGQTKRQQNCSAERLNNNEIVITHIVDTSALSFSWDSFGSSEIPIYSIQLYPAYDIKIENTYDFLIEWVFGVGRDCGASEVWAPDGKNYSPDCAYQISGDQSWLGNKDPINHHRYILNSGKYNWIGANNYDQLSISYVEANNFCSKSYKDYQSKRWWWMDSNLVCIKR